MENVTAVRVLSYLKNRSLYSDKKATVRGGMECRDLSIGQIVTLTSPARVLAAKEYMIQSVTKDSASFQLELREYDDKIYDDEVIAPPTGPTGRDYIVKGPETWVGPIILGDGINQSATVTMIVADGQGDIYFAGKSDAATFDFASWAVDGGFILGIDDSIAGNPARFFIGDSGGNNLAYSTDTGVLAVTGTITATLGVIGGWTIGATTLSVVDGLTIDAANKRIRSSNYVSGAMGAGFILKPDLLEVGNAAIRGILRTSVLGYDSISVHSGSDITVKGGDVLTVDMTADDNTTF